MTATFPLGSSSASRTESDGPHSKFAEISILVTFEKIKENGALWAGEPLKTSSQARAAQS